MDIPIRTFKASKVADSRYQALLQLAQEIPGITKVTVKRGNPTLFILEFDGTEQRLVLKRQEVEIAVAVARLTHALTLNQRANVQRFAGHDFS